MAGEGLGRLRASYGRVLERSEDRSEEHRTKGLHCLELWTSLLEVVAWDRTRQRWPPEMTARLLAAIPLKQEVRKSSLFARMLGR